MACQHVHLRGDLHHRWLSRLLSHRDLCFQPVLKLINIHCPRLIATHFGGVIVTANMNRNRIAFFNITSIPYLLQALCCEILSR